MGTRKKAVRELISWRAWWGESCPSKGWGRGLPSVRRTGGRTEAGGGGSEPREAGSVWVSVDVWGRCPGPSAAHCTYSMLGRHRSSMCDFSSAFKRLWFRGSCLMTAQLSTSFCQRGDIAESRFEAVGNTETTFECISLYGCALALGRLVQGVPLTPLARPPPSWQAASSPPGRQHHHLREPSE